MKPVLSIVIPALNEAADIEAVRAAEAMVVIVV